MQPFTTYEVVVKLHDNATGTRAHRRRSTCPAQARGKRPVTDQAYWPKIYGRDIRESHKITTT